MPDDQTAPQTEAAGKRVYDQSTIQFPYGDLNDAVAVANGIMKCGGVACQPDQLAAALGQEPTSGNFRQKIAAARTFGIIETVQGRYQLTDLGFAITDKGRERAARVDAFLSVPLYRRVYEEFWNKQLPPRPVALEHAFVGFGVASKQKERARQAFDRSAQQAGFFDQGGRDRLIRPPVGSTSQPSFEDESGSSRVETDADTETGSYRGGGGGSNGTGGFRRGRLHPFIQGLLDSLPEPETNWAEEGRTKWLQAAANIFDLMYKGDARISVRGTPKEQDRGNG
jgi:hypothetical protein